MTIREFAIAATAIAPTLLAALADVNGPRSRRPPPLR